MSCNNFLSINNNIITVKGINTNDVWNITVINANFMLSKYNGRGPSNDISIIPFPNVGDGLYGDIVFSVNNNSCFKDCITNVNGDGSYFNVSPKYVTLHEKDETYNITVSSDCDNFTLTNENIDLISTPNSGTNYFTITSNTDASFENIEIIVTNNCNGLEETVYVSQKPSQESTNILTVNPQYINLYGNEKDFKVNIMSICSGNTKYKYDTNVEGLTLIDIGNIISGTVNSNENITKTFKVYNDCEEKNVTVKYDKVNEKETFLCITECPNNSASHEFTIDSLTKKYNILSSSNWYISTYDSNKVNCSKSGNNIIISLGNDRTECENEKIILKNKDGNEAIINYSVGAGLDVNDNIIFTFADGSKELNLTANTDYSVSACVIAYKNDNGLKKPIKWVNNSSGSFKSPFNTYSGGTDNCVNVEFTALPIIITTQSETTKEYTITLQEQETYKTIKINVSVTKQCENNTIWTGLTVTASDMGKCETTSSSIKVTANGVNTNDKCESGETSTTISNYDVIYNPSGTNETEISREILITVIGKGDYINASGETIVTQASGPCTSPPAYEEVYEWDRLIVSGTNMDACDDESILTIIAEGTKTNSDGTDEDVEENISIERCTITYEPSGANETEEEREVTITIEFEGVDEEITVIQAAGPCSCEEKDVWTSIIVSSEKEDIEACDEIETLDIITVTAHGEHIGKDCNSATTSTTLSSSDYTITYTPNDKNQTNSEREISINVVGKGDYSHLSESTTITQAAGPCTPIYTFTDSTPSSNLSISYSANGSSIHVISTKNGANFNDITVSESCDWVTTLSPSLSGTYYYIPFNLTENTSTSSRSCNVTVTQGESGKKITVTITQEGKPATCDCSTVSISCNPANSYTTGNSVSTVVTVNAGSNCSTKWKAYSSSGSYLGEGESGKSLSRTTTGTVTFRSDACSGKTTTWTISEPECKKPSIRLTGSSDDYSVSSVNETAEWCDGNVSVNISTNCAFIGNNDHDKPINFNFEMSSAGVQITSISCDKYTFEHGSTGAFGIDFTITPSLDDGIFGGNCNVSGSFTWISAYNETGNTGTFSISIQFNG